MWDGTRMRGRSRCACGAALALVLTLPGGRGAAADSRPVYAPGEVLVRFKGNSSQGNRDQALGKVKAKVLKRLATELDLDLGEPGIHRVKTTMSVEDAVDL